MKYESIRTKSQGMLPGKGLGSSLLWNQGVYLAAPQSCALREEWLYWKRPKAVEGELHLLV